MAVIKAGSSQFPFHITDVAALLRLNIRRRGPDFLYVDCPLCGDHRGKLYLKTSRDVWHCNYCQESGGMLALYAKVYGISNADAYREICEALQTGDYAPEYQSYQNRQPQEIAQSARAPRQAIHQTLSILFSMLSLTPKHRAHLREVRGLTDDQIERFGFKSTPPPYLCKSLTARLLKQGCTLQGVPGFYLAEDGRWTVRFGTRTAGILIPARSADGLICGAQIRLDTPIREENAPADKEGTKYLWLSSSSKPMGTSSESPIHFVGDPCSRVVYVTEGLLKADICHALMHRTFAATAGANNVSKLDELFAFLKKNGTEEIIEAQDMDKYRNVHVEKGASKIYLMARKHELQCRRLTWNPNYKGLDDWQLALRKNAAKGPKTMTFRERYLHGVCEVSEIDACVERWHKAQPDGVPLQAYLGLLDEEYHAFLQPGGNARLAELLNAQRKQLGCRIYQLEFTNTEKTKPFAFSGIDALHKAGFQQPPASEYRLVRDEMLYCPKDEPDLAVLERVFDHYNGKLPADYLGRCIAPSDVLELYDAEKRRYYYPQNDDDVRKLYRSMVQSVIARCLGLPNLWKTNTTLTEIRPYWTTVQGSLHYTDYENGYAALSLMKGYGNYGHLEIGSASRCIGCGRLHDRRNSTHCGECEDMCVCKACGSVVPKNSGHFLDSDGFYCAECMQPCRCCGKLLPREALRPVLNRRGRTNQLCPSCEEAELANCRTCAARSCCKDLHGLLFCKRSRYTQIELEEQYA